MCMNCGCGEADKRHKPTDITRDDLQRAADGGDQSFDEVVANVHASIDKLGQGHGAMAGRDPGSPG